MLRSYNLQIPGTAPGCKDCSEITTTSSDHFVKPTTIAERIEKILRLLKELLANMQLGISWDVAERSHESSARRASYELTLIDSYSGTVVVNRAPDVS